MALFHGAGSNCEAGLMMAVAEAFSQSGVLVFRGDLPFRQQRVKGPPRGNSKHDQEGIRRAAEELRSLAPEAPLVLAGHSYGGRQCSILAAEDPFMITALLLLSYPLHPPGNASSLRTGHFPALRTPALFVHGTRDPFGTIEEMQAALTLIPARTELVVIEGAGHGVPESVATLLPGRLSNLIESLEKLAHNGLARRG
jgi:uncharacterized protein